MRLWGSLKRGEYILSVGITWITGGRRADCGSQPPKGPQWPSLLDVMSLCNLPPRWIMAGLCDQYDTAEVTVCDFQGLSWVTCSGGSYNVMKMLKLPFGETHMKRNWVLLPRANIDLPARRVSHVGSGFPSPRQTFRGQHFACNLPGACQPEPPAKLPWPAETCEWQ